MKPENVSFDKENDFRSIKITSFLTIKKRGTDGTSMSGINGSVR